jgi:hypothetical protein
MLQSKVRYGKTGKIKKGNYLVLLGDANGEKEGVF